MANENCSVEYRLIEGFPAYRVGNDGSVWSLWEKLRPGTATQWNVGTTWRRMSPGLIRDHETVNLTNGREKVQRYVHRMVLEAFVGPCPAGMECCHNDGNPRNNALGNLRWDTKKANANDKRGHGTMYQGERCHTAMIKASDVVTIRQRWANGERQVDLAAEYGIGATTINSIVRRKSWKHVI